MNVKEMASMIGQEYLMDVQGLTIVVMVDDARKQFGRVDVLVKPVGGIGETWVVADRLMPYEY